MKKKICFLSLLIVVILLLTSINANALSILKPRNKAKTYTVTVVGLDKDTGSILYANKDIVKADDCTEKTYKAIEVDGYELHGKSTKTVQFKENKTRYAVNFYFAKKQKSPIKDETTAPVNRVLDLRTDKICLVSGSNGMKGSYEIGVYKALQELGILDNVDSYLGTSIGSINSAGLITLGIDKLEDLWRSIKDSSQIYNGSLTESQLESYEAFLNDACNNDDYGDLMIVLLGLVNTCQGKTLDTTPLRNMLESNISVDKLLASPKNFGFFTINLNKLSLEMYTRDDLNKNNVIDSIMCSSSAFPVFPLGKITTKDGVTQNAMLDGGYISNTNASYAFSDMNATKAIIIDLVTSPDEEYVNREDCLYIYPSKTIGTFLEINEQLISNNIELGYNDTMNYFKNVTIIK